MVTHGKKLLRKPDRIKYLWCMFVFAFPILRTLSLSLCVGGLASPRWWIRKRALEHFIDHRLITIRWKVR